METSAIYSEAPVATRPSPDSIQAQAVTSREVSEAQSAIIVAKRFPRNEIDVLDKVLNACQRQSLAESAIYSYSRGGTEISGPSIRLAETLIRIWGNAACGIRELENRAEESVLEAFAVDLETNVRQIKIFTVKNERTTKKGTYRLEDARDRYENLANFGARRLRSCILAIIPGDVIEAAVSQCEQTLKTKADTSPEALKKLVEAFEKFSITKEQIEKRIQRHLDTITPAQLVNLRKVYNSLKDGMSGPADWFEVVVEPQVDATQNLKDKIKAREKKTPMPASPQEQVDEDSEVANSEEMAPGECPNAPSTVFLKSHCDQCKSRVGCPAWASV